VSADADQTLLALRDVSFRHWDRPVLSGASLSLRAGERVALVGLNGAGKSTLLHLLVGLIPPSAGSVWAFGRERTRESDFHEVRARAGLLFQDSEDQLFCPTVLEDLAFGPLNLGRGRRQARRDALRVLDRLGLGGYEERVPHRLSAGEKRLVALGTVLAMDPEVLLLDEPTNGLDTATASRLTELLETMDKTLLMVSHDLAFIERLATRAVALVDGRVEPAAMHRHPHRHLHSHLHLHVGAGEAEHGAETPAHGDHHQADAPTAGPG
jgi:cobalt/nickel transport system ATP-binding protein